MSGTVRRWAVRLVAAIASACALILAFASCNTPFIPIPPPADPTFTPVVTTDPMGGTRMVWQASGPAMKEVENARVFLFNLDHGVGVIVRANQDGSYVIGPFEGKMGDRIELQYERTDRERSPYVCRVLAVGLARTGCDR